MPKVRRFLSSPQLLVLILQNLVSEAVREERIRLRREVIELNNSAIQKTRENGETHKQLIARSNFLLFKLSGQKVK